MHRVIGEGEEESLCWLEGLEQEPWRGPGSAGQHGKDGHRDISQLWDHTDFIPSPSGDADLQGRCLTLPTQPRSIRQF